MSLFSRIINFFKRNNNIEQPIIENTKNDIKDIQNIKDTENIKDTIINWEDTVKFTVPIIGGQVIKVYDGDSITIASYLPIKNSPLYRFSVRLNGIDTPEIKGKNDDEKEAAKNARDALSLKILNKYIILKNIDTEKYGRILADVYIDETHINEWLINERYAIFYDGGTKIPPKSWLEYKSSGKID